MRRSVQETTVTFFVNSHKSVIQILKYFKEKRRILKEKSHLFGGSFYVKEPKTRMKWELLAILTINSLY